MTESDRTVRVELAEPSDARILTSIQAEAFDHEADLFRMEENMGPDGYDSVEWARAYINDGTLLKILRGDDIVGGMKVTLKKDGKARLNRIFIDPGQQGKGYASAAVEILKTRYPEVKVWEVDTPSWAIRNQRFYEKVGFVKEDHSLIPSTGMILYIYRMKGA